jgi:hypothetical protein
MKSILLFFVCLIPLSLFSQFGIKAGVNYANVSSTSSFTGKSRSGFHAGVILAPVSKKLISSRTEVIFSRQGYNYQTGRNTGSVNLDYIQAGQLMSVNITKYFSLMVGAQTAYLVSAQVDSVIHGTTGAAAVPGIMSLYNRVDYGYAIGAEVHPLKGLLIGARYNVSINKVYKSLQTGQRPSFTSEDAKNNVMQLFIGYRLGTKKDKD